MILILFVVFVYIIFLHDIILTYINDKNKKLIRLKKLVSPIYPNVYNLKVYQGKRNQTLNKRKITLVLRDPTTGKEYSENRMVYILLHEIAHVECDDIGHTEKWSQTFHDLLKKAELLKIYHPNLDFRSNTKPKTFCYL
jgi:beta-lactamase regulating signal transducer with metallopeptidase domain